MLEVICTFLVVCFVTAFVCAALKEDEDRRLFFATGRLFGILVGGIVGFALVVQAVTLLAR